MTAPPEKGERSPRILIVDDDRTILAVLTRILEKHGYDVDTADSGYEAMDKLAAERYTAAVIDVKLGDMSGLDLLEIIRSSTPETLTIMLTGHPSEEDQAIALGRGADFYLVKPIKAERLIMTIDGKLRKATYKSQ